MHAYVATTGRLCVSVRPVYLSGQSDVLARRFVFAYYVRIENGDAAAVQLRRRHWVIRADGGRTVEVEGEGVVGRQPLIRPGEVHEYASFSVLETMSGTMEGTYLMERPDGSTFYAQIPRFHLRAAAN